MRVVVEGNGGGRGEKEPEKKKTEGRLALVRRALLAKGEAKKWRKKLEIEIQSPLTCQAR